jgi:hypothetical protein
MKNALSNRLAIEMDTFAPVEPLNIEVRKGRKIILDSFKSVN